MQYTAFYELQRYFEQDNYGKKLIEMIINDNKYVICLFFKVCFSDAGRSLNSDEHG